MADPAQRSKEQIAWEDEYVEKVNFWAEVDYLILEDRAAVRAASASAASTDSQTALTGSVGLTSVNLPAPGDYATLTGNKTLNDSEGGKISIVSGEFLPPEGIQLASVVNGRVILPTGKKRSEYNKLRVIATEKTKAAGFMSISEDMFTFASGAEDGNVFAPDFIEILALLHANLKQLYPNGKVKANSGYRWWNETKGLEYSMHEAGCAIDIGTRDPNGAVNLSRSYQVADIAWELGLRSVFVAQTFVHIDLGPDGGGYSYPPVPKYRGPESH